jgi:23S rRNA pseudouridine2604 synthase
MKEPMRLQKYLSQQGILSRRKAEECIQKGWIKVNGKVVTQMGTTVIPGRDVVEVMEAVDQLRQSFTTIAFYKPRGIVTNLPQKGETEIRDLLPLQYKKLSPVGRLDKESEGLIILTDDGILAKKLLDHHRPHEREYEVSVDIPLIRSQIDRLMGGVVILGDKTQPLHIERISEYTYRFTMVEGKNRQIRRMLKLVGREVTRLVRVRFGKLKLMLKEGRFKEISAVDVL